MAQQPFKVSNSKLNTWRRCPKRFKFKYVDKLERRQKSVQLERGSWIHALLEAYYDGEDWIALHKRLSLRFYQLDEEDREDLGDMPNECLRIMRAYLRHYAQIDQGLVVVDTELNEYVELKDGVLLNVVIDLIVEDSRTGLLWAWDHKSRKNFKKEGTMIRDPQLTLYYGALEKMGYSPLGGVVYNEIRTKPPTVPQVLKSGGLSRAKNIDTDVYTYLRAIRTQGLDPSDYRDILRTVAARGEGNFFRRVHIPKDPPLIHTMMREALESAEEMQEAIKKDRFPRSFDDSCEWGCDFEAPCVIEAQGGDIQPILKMNFRRRGQMD